MATTIWIGPAKYLAAVRVSRRCWQIDAAAVCLAFLLPSAAFADQCARWDLSGRFSIRQSNGFTVNFNLIQTGNGLQGSADYGSTRGNVSGHFSSFDEFEMTVRWNNG